MDRVTGGSLPAAIWKRFMTAATNVVARAEPPAEATAEAPAQQNVTSAPKEAKPAPKEEKPAPKEATQAASSRRCDYQACGRTYQSFRASDCTYQPYGSSERRACDMSSSQRTADFPFASGGRSTQSSDRPGRGQCNAAACSATYESFDPGTCTYQPYDGGPPRVCTK
jgi:penicillin-binding protein 1A